VNEDHLHRHHLVVGDGAVGTVLAASLAASPRCGSRRVRVAARSVQCRERRPYVARGLLSPDRFADLDTMPLAPSDNPAAVAWLTVKAPGLETVLDSGVLDGVSTVVPLLNGVDHVDALRDRLGKDRVVPGAIRVLAERMPDRTVRLASRRPVVEVSAAPPAVAGVLDGAARDLRDAGVTVLAGRSAADVVWSKAAYFLPLGLATVLAGGAVGKARRDGALWAQILASSAELVRLAGHENADLTADEVARELAMAPATMTTSLQRDAAGRRAGEFEHLYQGLARRAARHATPCPVTQLLVRQAQDLTN
jgi:2-dehydropantoate 2-reductase